MVQIWGRSPKGERPHKGVKYKGSVVFFFIIFFFIFIRFFQQPTGHHKQSAHANYGSERVFWCKEVPLGGLNDS